MRLFIQSPTIRSPNTTTSINAVGFAMTANPKKMLERIRYFIYCLWFFPFLLSEKLLRKINPPRSASSVSAKTPISVLLSTNTRKDPIPLVSHKRSSPHPIKKSDGLPSSSLFFLKQRNHSLIAPSPKISTSIPLKALTFTATVSFAIEKRCSIGPRREKKKLINPCRKYGIVAHGPLFPRSIPVFSAMIFGIYIYS